MMVCLFIILCSQNGVLFQKFVNFSSGRWNILLHDLALAVNEEGEGDGVELELAGEEIPFVGGEKEVLALNAVVGEELLAWLARRVLLVEELEETDGSVFVLLHERALVEHSPAARSTADAPEIHVDDVAGISFYD